MRRAVAAFLVSGLWLMSACQKAATPEAPILSDKDREKVAQQLAALPRPVPMTLYTDEKEDRFSPKARQLLSEVDALSDKVTVTFRDIAGDADEAAADGVSMAPALLIGGASASPLRFLGVPMGYEFQTLMEGIGVAAAGNAGLMPETRQFLASLRKPVTLKVMSTPT